MAAGTSIGMAVTDGDFRIDHAHVSGNATLFDGSSIETAMASSQLQLKDGVVMRLAGNARATVYQHKLVLERGSGQMESATGYDVEARSLRISPVTRDTVTRISLERGRNVQVAAVRGAVRVSNSAGQLVANIAAGSSLNFEPQAEGIEAVTNASGCVLDKGGTLILAEQTNNVVLEVQGPGLGLQTGNRVQILGTAVRQAPGVSGASQVIRVTTVKLIAKGGCKAIAKALGASAAQPAGAAAAATPAAGIGAGTIAVIGGVATAGVVGGLAVSGSLPGQGNAPSASR
jgi:hypothetical protein